MNKFIGTKEVLAKPMTRREYNDYRGWELPENELSQADDAGFLVEYVDGGKANDTRHAGYISWSPADVFHRAYKTVDTWLDRVKLEQAELQIKLDALDKMLNVAEKPEHIEDEQWLTMFSQQFHMRMTNQCLLKRISLAEAVPDAPTEGTETPLQGSESNLA